jgi:hypothetical protein
MYCRCAGRADKGKETFLDLPARCAKTVFYITTMRRTSFSEYCVQAYPQDKLNYALADFHVQSPFNVMNYAK